MKEFFFDTEELDKSDKFLVLIIYDISENKKRNKVAHLLESYGFRVQKSAFEGFLNKKLYEQLIRALEHIAVEQDSIRVYKISGRGEVKTFGASMKVEEEEVIII